MAGLSINDDIYIFYKQIQREMEDTPYFCCISIDKSCFEVGIRTNDDWRTTISEDIQILGRFKNEEEAMSAFERYRFDWAVKQATHRGEQNE